MPRHQPFFSGQRGGDIWLFLAIMRESGIILGWNVVAVEMRICLVDKD